MGIKKKNIKLNKCLRKCGGLIFQKINIKPVRNVMKDAIKISTFVR
jgi:hypothetical protein